MCSSDNNYDGAVNNWYCYEQIKINILCNTLKSQYNKLPRVLYTIYNVIRTSQYKPQTTYRENYFCKILLNYLSVNHYESIKIYL